MMAARSGHGGRNSRCGGQGVPFADWVGASWRERSDGRMAGQWQTAAVKYLGLLDDDRQETRYQLDAIADITNYAEEIRAAVQRHLTG